MLRASGPRSPWLHLPTMLANISLKLPRTPLPTSGHADTLKLRLSLRSIPAMNLISLLTGWTLSAGVCALCKWRMAWYDRKHWLPVTSPSYQSCVGFVSRRIRFDTDLIQYSQTFCFFPLTKVFAGTLSKHINGLQQQADQQNKELFSQAEIQDIAYIKLRTIQIWIPLRLAALSLEHKGSNLAVKPGICLFRFCSRGATSQVQTHWQHLLHPQR